jgi:hypothetical protein
MTKQFSRVTAVVSVLFIGGSAADAQVITATISGTVSEASQAVVPGATVEVKNIDTGLVRTGVTDGQGRYRVPNLPVGPYAVQVSLTGFRTELRSGITLTVGREAVVDFVLQVGAVAEQIVVTGEAPLINTTTSEVSGLVDQKTINDLPLNGRDLMQLLTLEPGVATIRSANRGVASGGRGQRVSIHGARETQTLFLLDGTQLNDTMSTSPGGEAGVFMGAEAVQEFKVLLHNFSAEYGRAAGGVFNAVTKSGTNALHGSVFEFHRNSDLDARNFFDQEKPPFRRHQFGASLGGPIVRNRAFFFGNYEGLRDRLTQTALFVVPSAAGRQGNLGATRVNVNPAVVPYLALFPLPNSREFGDGTGELATQTVSPTDEDYFTGRVDYVVGAKDSVFARYTYDNSERTAPDPGRMPEFPISSQSKRTFVTLEGTRILSERLINVARAGFSRSKTQDIPDPLDPHTDLAFAPDRKLGSIRVTGLANIGSTDTDARTFILSAWQFGDSLSWTKGRHQAKFGVDFTHYSFQQTDAGGVNGEFQFTSLANFLQGIPRQFSVGGIGPLAIDTRTFVQTLTGVFVQDDVKVRSNLTVNLGLRYEFASVPQEKDGQWATLVNLTDRTTTLEHPIFENPTRRNFAPRVGFAWDPRADGKMSLRGGVGVFFDPPLSTHWRNRFNNPPFRVEGTLRSPVPVFPNSAVVQRDIYVAGTAPSTLFLVEPEPKAAHLVQYNVTLQRELWSGNVVSIGYAGHRGRNLGLENDVNTAAPAIQPDGQAFFAPGLPILNPSFARMRLISYNGESEYNALLLSWSRRLDRGLQVQVSYAYSRTFDSGSLTMRGFGDNRRQQTLQDWRNPDGDWGPADFDIPHNLVISGNYELPFGPGKPTGSDTSGFVAGLIGGWQVGVVFTSVSGEPFNPKVGFDVDRDGSTDNQTRPNVVPNMDATIGTVDRWFDPAAFSLQPLGYFGNAGRNLLRGPAMRTLDLAIRKDVRLWESGELQLRVEMFNALNRANFGLPLSTVFDSNGRVASAGRITDTVTPARQMQVAAKLVF